MSNLPLENELRRALADVQRQIEVVSNEADEMLNEKGELGIPVSEMRHSDGTWPMIPLLVAKSQILNGLAVVRSKKP